MSNTNRVFVLSGPIGLGRLDERSRERLKHARLEAGSDLVAPEARLAERLGVDAALLRKATTRFLGEHARPGDGWTVAADPVYLEPRLDHLCLMAQLLDGPELEALAAHLGESLAGGGLEFITEGGGLYVRSERAFATSEYPTTVIDGLLPNKYLPAGDGANEFRTLLAEIEMSLHEHPVNQSRQSRGLRPVNSLWLWGGSEPATVPARSMPRLISDNAVLRGLWRLHGAETAEQASLDDALVAGDELVADIGDDLESVARLLDTGRPMTVFSRDGFTLEASGAGAWQFWKRRHPALEPGS